MCIIILIIYLICLIFFLGLIFFFGDFVVLWYILKLCFIKSFNVDLIINVVNIIREEIV